MTEIQERLFELFNEANEQLFQTDLDNILMGVNERNLCGCLASYIGNLQDKYGLNEYYADTEYNRKQNGEIKTILDGNMEEVRINCDLILHSRGESVIEDNMLAIEMKKSDRPEDHKLSDKIRLRALTKNSFDDIWSNDGETHPEHVCGYELGIYMEIDINNREMILEGYASGNMIFESSEEF